MFVKNKLKFGDTLLDTLNCYMIYGRDRLIVEPDSIKMLVQMADEALFCVEPTVTINNAEGAMVIQIMFQIF